MDRNTRVSVKRRSSCSNPAVTEPTNERLSRDLPQVGIFVSGLKLIFNVGSINTVDVKDLRIHAAWILCFPFDEFEMFAEVLVVEKGVYRKVIGESAGKDLKVEDSDLTREVVCQKILQVGHSLPCQGLKASPDEV